MLDNENKDTVFIFIKKVQMSEQVFSTGETGI